jgi:hypothetical protein
MGLFNESIFIFLELCYEDKSQSKFIVVLIVLSQFYFYKKFFGLSLYMSESVGCQEATN